MPNQYTRTKPPTPAEIRRECRRIQSEWSDQERQRRSGGRETEYTVPQVRGEEREPE